MRKAERQPTTELTLYGGIWCKRWTLPEAGMVVPQHAHSFDHLTYVVSGSIRVWRGNVLHVCVDYHAPCAIRVAARQPHTFQALEAGVVLLCLHNMDHAEDGEPPIHAHNTLPED